MITLNYMDNKYTAIRRGVIFYFFGDGCIADYYSNSIAYVDEKDLEIVHLCDGKNKVIDVMEKSATLLVETSEQIQNRINKLIKKGVVVLKREPCDVETAFWGVKGSFYSREIVIELTSTCIFYCPFCYKNASAKKNFMSDYAFDKLHQIIKPYVKNILLSGGDPTLHPSYLKYIDLLSKYSDVHMITNGSIFFEHDPKVLKKLDLIQFSMYGCNNAEYKRMTGMKDGFSRLCKSIEFAKRNGINMYCAVTLCDETMDHIEFFVKTAIKLEMKALRIGFADVFGRGKHLYEANSHFIQKRGKKYGTILELKRRYRNIINLEVPNINIEHVENHDDISTNVFRGSLSCGCGSQYIVISCKGEIRPCQTLPEEWFSIHEQNALQEHICGDFHIEHLCKSIKKYYRDNAFTELGIEPCYSLQQFQKQKKKYL